MTSRDRTRRAAVVLLVATCAVGAPAAARPVTIGRHARIEWASTSTAPWPMRGGDASRRSRSRARGPAQPPTLVWEIALGIRQPFAPLVGADGTIYVGGGGGLVAVRPDGQVAWRLDVGDLAGSPVILPSGELVLTLDDGSLARVTREGRVCQRGSVGVELGAMLALPDATLVLGAGDRTLRFVDATLHEARLPIDSGEEVIAPPVRLVGGGLAASTRRRLLLWRPGLPVDDVVFAAPLVTAPAAADDGDVWIGTAEALLRVAPDGRMRARSLHPGLYVSFARSASRDPSLAVGQDGAVRIAAMAIAVRAAPQPIGPPPQQFFMLAIGATGAERWRAPLSGARLGEIVLDRDDTAFALADDGFLWAIAADGTVRYSAAILQSSDAATPVLGADGTIYLASVGGFLRALR